MKARKVYEFKRGKTTKDALGLGQLRPGSTVVFPRETYMFEVDGRVILKSEPRHTDSEKYLGYLPEQTNLNVLFNNDNRITLQWGKLGPIYRSIPADEIRRLAGMKSDRVYEFRRNQGMQRSLGIGKTGQPVEEEQISEFFDELGEYTHAFNKRISGKSGYPVFAISARVEHTSRDSEPYHYMQFEYAEYAESIYTKGSGGRTKLTKKQMREHQDYVKRATERTLFAYEYEEFPLRDSPYRVRRDGAPFKDNARLMIKIYKRWREK